MFWLQIFVQGKAITKANQWWSEVKRIAGMALAPHSDSFLANLQIEGSTPLPKQEIAKRIDFAFLPLIRSPSKGLNPFSPKLRICHL